tara:strand:- start:2766 stop:3116 length:351 start_codon:yes stop_codon:yes gene_type:complete
MIAGRLTMRAQLLRNQATGTDSWNQPVAPDYKPVGDPLACFIYSKKSGEIVDGEKVALVGDLRGLFALGADITADDRLTNITNRRGEVLIAGPLSVEGPVERKHTHREAALKVIAA